MNRSVSHPAISLAPLASLSRGDLLAMLEAGEDILECYRVLRKAELNIVGEVLRGQGTFVEFDHYPKDDVHDSETHSQYYYHAHRGAEHGHFHTFLRAGGMPEGAVPAANNGCEPWPAGEDAIAHLIAISMDDYGYPAGLFATNRWVSGETWYPAETVIHMLGRFRMDHAFPSWPVNRWISAMLRLFRPEIETLLRHRDAVIVAWQASHPGIDVFEDRNLEITGQIAVLVEEQIGRVRSALAQVGSTAGSGLLPAHSSNRHNFRRTP